jgi:hypothetical protein
MLLLIGWVLPAFSRRESLVRCVAMFAAMQCNVMRGGRLPTGKHRLGIAYAL